jgi:hypothetical protein
MDFVTKAPYRLVYTIKVSVKTLTLLLCWFRWCCWTLSKTLRPVCIIFLTALRTRQEDTVMALEKTWKIQPRLVSVIATFLSCEFAFENNSMKTTSFPACSEVGAKSEVDNLVYALYCIVPSCYHSISLYCTILLLYHCIVPSCYYSISLYCTISLL